MSVLHAIRGRIVDAHRHINTNVYWRRPPGPPERYELWIRQEDGRERKFTVNTRTMPARRGHAVALIVKTNAKPPPVLGFFNASTMDAVNYLRSDPPALLHVWEFMVLAVGFVAMAALWGDTGMLLLC